mgnify:CR=1 FL=1
MKYEILIADDHSIIRDGLRKILEDTDDIQVSGEASNGNMVLEKVRERDWSAIILDLSMPGRSGIELVKLVKSEKPKLPILIFSMHPEEQYAVRAIKAGASGYLSKESDSDLLVPALRKVLQGSMFISPKVAELLASDVTPDSKDKLPHQRLSDREFEVFTRIVKGQSLTDIADELAVSIKTISTHKTHILEKMGMSNQVDLVHYAIEHHLIDQ